VKEGPACSAAEKRKRQSKMLQGKTVDHAVTPSTVIAELVLAEKGQQGPSKTHPTVVVPLRSCVWGTIVELNDRLTPQVLLDDPLLDGFVAIILPSGRFPPLSPPPPPHRPAESSVLDNP
jgi:hypothetical protein